MPNRQRNNCDSCGTTDSQEWHPHPLIEDETVCDTCVLEIATAAMVRAAWGDE